jgi:hypothetical protein
MQTSQYGINQENKSTNNESYIEMKGYKKQKLRKEKRKIRGKKGNQMNIKFDILLRLFLYTTQS